MTFMIKAGFGKGVPQNVGVKQAMVGASEKR
jgi:hypothetical protein